MPDTLKPVKRVWKPKAPAAVLPAWVKFDVYGSELPELDVREKNSASVWATFEELQAPETTKAANPKWWK
jgi:hypothetical protein